MASFVFQGVYVGGVGFEERVGKEMVVLEKCYFSKGIFALMHDQQ